MIEPYEFIDAKPDGTKERQLGPTVLLYNKLSAEETNNIRAKLNELVDAANFSPIPLYEVFALKFKGEDNTDMLNIEAGDIAHRYSTVDGIWENARFNGGDPQDPANYTTVDGPFTSKIQFTADGITDTFDVLTASKVVAVFWNGALVDDADWLQTDTEIALTFVPAAGDKIKPI